MLTDARNLMIESSFGTVSTLNERINYAVSVWPHIPDAEKITAKPEPVLCQNATAGLAAWYCFHFAGRVTKGKEAVNERNRCEACEKAEPPYEEAPSFMQTDDN